MFKDGKTCSNCKYYMDKGQSNNWHCTHEYSGKVWAYPVDSCKEWEEEIS